MLNRLDVICPPITNCTKFPDIAHLTSPKEYSLYFCHIRIKCTHWHTVDVGEFGP